MILVVFILFQGQIIPLVSQICAIQGHIEQLQAASESVASFGDSAILCILSIWLMSIIPTSFPPYQSISDVFPI